MSSYRSAPRPPAGATTEAHPLETLAFRLLGGVAAAGALLWLTGQLSGRIFGGAWPPVEPSEVASVVLEYPHHLGDPGDGAVAGTVERVTRVGFEVRLDVATPDGTVIVTQTRPQFLRLGVSEGAAAWVRPEPGAATVPALEAVPV